MQVIAGGLSDDNVVYAPLHVLLIASAGSIPRCTRLVWWVCHVIRKQEMCALRIDVRGYEDSEVSSVLMYTWICNSWLYSVWIQDV